MSFEIKRLDSRCWAVLDECDNTVFSGSLGACQQWLDVHENSTPGKHSSVVSCLLDTFFRIVTLGRFQPGGK